MLIIGLSSFELTAEGRGHLPVLDEETFEAGVMIAEEEAAEATLEAAEEATEATLELAEEAAEEAAEAMLEPAEYMGEVLFPAEAGTAEAEQPAPVTAVALAGPL
jgi:hypothetical protein